MHAMYARVLTIKISSDSQAFAPSVWLKDRSVSIVFSFSSCANFSFTVDNGKLPRVMNCDSGDVFHGCCFVYLLKTVISTSSSWVTSKVIDHKPPVLCLLCVFTAPLVNYEMFF